MRFNLTRIDEANKARSYLADLVHRGAQAVEITEKRRPRSLPQNALFHLWVRAFADAIGEEDVEKCKIDIKRHLLGQYTALNPATGKIETYDFRTSLLDATRMSELMDKFKAWALNEFGCILPYYGEAGYDDMYYRYSQ